MTKPRRRQAGEGGISEYATKAGVRYLIKYTAPQEDGTKRIVLKRGFLTRKAAGEELREQRTKVVTGTHVLTNRVTVGAHMAEWLDGLRLGQSTVASYRKNVRLHIEPYLGDLRLDQLTGTRLTAHYRKLETSGRFDGTGGLSARTVRYVHTIIHSALGAAVRDGRLALNPADKATPPTARESISPEMKTWDSEELRRFLDWSQELPDELYQAWLLLAMTGMRRGEALALRWGDFDFTSGTVSVRRSAGLIRVKGKPVELLIGPPKSGRSRVVDLDPQSLAAMRSYRAQRGTLSLALAHADSYVLGDINGEVRHPERFSRTFHGRLVTARKALGADLLPEIRLHDLRHTHATLLLQAGVHPKIVSERLGHAKVSITMDVYSHAVPTLQREAASKLAGLVYGTGA
ncbi:tyrosine-type recombinase/integrase [Lacisediminihabitans profunda]|uniref:Site-specific integrase n=1 Tax=Lacisediminihabitans profunda TaxID=2594790 RepID=A0A5C8ULW0_9MICO|nr:site-specific integrase [Lacisediminihabitans profunda]TXN29303.1 site-specific integrase [Lacisediminihabitans profunda]